MFFESDLYERDEAYLKREKLETEYEINKNHIRVSAPQASTCFVSIRRNTYIEQADFKQLIKDVRREARRSGAKLKGINKLADRIEEKYMVYTEAFKAYDKQFDVLAVLWKHHVNEIRVGHRDDTFLNEVLYPLAHSIQAMWYQNKILMIYRNRYHRLQKLLEKLMEGTVIKATVS